MLVFKGTPALGRGGTLMRRDRFRSLTHSLTAGTNIEEGDAAVERKRSV